MKAGLLHAELHVPVQGLDLAPESMRPAAGVDCSGVFLLIVEDKGWGVDRDQKTSPMTFKHMPWSSCPSMSVESMCQRHLVPHVRYPAQLVVPEAWPEVWEEALASVWQAMEASLLCSQGGAGPRKLLSKGFRHIKHILACVCVCVCCCACYWLCLCSCVCGCLFFVFCLCVCLVLV